MSRTNWNRDRRAVHLQARIAQRDAAADPASAPGATGASAAADVASSVAATDIDWIAVEAAVTGVSAPVGISVTSFQGVLTPPSPQAPAGVRWSIRPRPFPSSRRRGPFTSEARH